MTYSFWCFTIVFAPLLIVALVLKSYDKFVLGIDTKSERRTLTDYSAGQIAYCIFGGGLLFGALLGGAMLLDAFEPASKTLCYLYYFSMSISLVGAFVGEHSMKRFKKSALFGTFVFFISLLPALIAFAAIYYNGSADSAIANRVMVNLVYKRTALTRSGYTYIMAFESQESGSRIFESPKERHVSRKIYEGLTKGQEMEVYLKPGALSIPWIMKLVVEDILHHENLDGRVWDDIPGFQSRVSRHLLQRECLPTFTSHFSSGVIRSSGASH